MYFKTYTIDEIEKPHAKDPTKKYKYWRARLYFDWDETTGTKPKPHDLYGKTKREVQEKVNS